MLPPDLPGADSPDDEVEFERQLTELIADLPDSLLHNMRILLAGCTQSALSVWREPGVPDDVVAEVEALTSLTEERVRAMNEATDPPILGRLLLTAPCRMHAVVSLGLALFDTPLLDRLTDFFNHRASLEAGTWERIQQAARDIGGNLLKNLEERTPGPLYDVEDIQHERTDDDFEAPRYTGNDLLLRRLRIEGLVERVFRHWETPLAIGDAAPAAADAGEVAVAPPYALEDAEFFTEPYLEMPFLAPQLAMLQLAVRMPLILHLLPEHRFGERVGRLRWLRDPARLRALAERLVGVTPEEEPVQLSLADLLTLLQGSQFVALALVGDVMREIDEALAVRAGELPQPPPEGAHSLGGFFDAPPDEDGESPRRLICGMVEGFVAVVRRALDEGPDAEAAEREEFQQAQAEVDELAEEV